MRTFFNIYGYLGFINFLLTLGYFLYLQPNDIGWGRFAIILLSCLGGLKSLAVAFIASFIIFIVTHTKEDAKTKQPFFLKMLSLIKSRNILLTIAKTIGILYSTAIVVFTVWCIMQIIPHLSH